LERTSAGRPATMRREDAAVSTATATRRKAKTKSKQRVVVGDLLGPNQQSLHKSPPKEKNENGIHDARPAGHGTRDGTQYVSASSRRVWSYHWRLPHLDLARLLLAFGSLLASLAFGTHPHVFSLLYRCLCCLSPRYPHRPSRTASPSPFATDPQQTKRRNAKREDTPNWPTFGPPKPWRPLFARPLDPRAC
jgi:hypothetical protein